MKSCLENIRPGDMIVCRANSGNEYFYLAYMGNVGTIYANFHHTNIVDWSAASNYKANGVIPRLLPHRIIRIIKAKITE